MNCTEAKFVMPLVLSNELDALAFADFECHVEVCGSCSRELAYSQYCDDLLRDAYREEPVDTLNLRRSVLNEISRSSQPRRHFFGRPVYALPIVAGLLLVIVIGVGYYSLRSNSSPAIYSAAFDDHFEEVVRHASIPGWHEGSTDIKNFVDRQLGDANVPDKLAPAGYHLQRARLCDLPDKEYVHLVYKNDAREISIYVRRKDAELPVGTVETVNGCALHATVINKFEIAAFQSQKYTVLVVSDLPRAESLSIARAAAIRLT